MVSGSGFNGSGVLGLRLRRLQTDKQLLVLSLFLERPFFAEYCQASGRLFGDPLLGDYIWRSKFGLLRSVRLMVFMACRSSVLVLV